MTEDFEIRGDLVTPYLTAELLDDDAVALQVGRGHKRLTADEACALGIWLLTGRDLAAIAEPAPCPTGTGTTRETVGMVCQTCGTDYAHPTQPDAYQDDDGRVWLNLRKHPDGWPGAYDFDSGCTPLYLRPSS